MSKIYPDLQITKVSLDLNALFFLLEHQWAFEPSVIVVYESLSCPQCEKINIKIIQSLLERLKYTTILENQRICGTWRIFLKNSRQFNCSGQTRDSWTIIKKHTAVDHSGNNTALRINMYCKCLSGFFFRNSTIIFSCWLYVHIFYVKYLIQVSTK